MKKLLFILSFFISASLSAQTIHYKTLYNDTTRTNDLGTLVAGKDTAYFFGTSIVFGYNLDNQLNRWTSVLSRRMGVVEANFGVNSATLMKRTPLNPWGATNFLDNLAQIPTKTGRRKYIFVAYGINDARWNTVNYDTVNFKADYRTALNNMITTKGWLASDITLISPEWCKDPAAFVADHVSTGNTQVTTARYLLFVDAVLKLSIEYGTHYVDVYTPQRDGLGNKGYADNVHFNPGGSQFYADVVYKAVVSPTVYRETQTLAMNGLSEFYRIKLVSPDTLTNYFLPLGMRQSDHAVGVIDMANLVADAAINNRGVMSIDSQSISGVKMFQNNGSFGGPIPLANAVGTMTLYTASGTNFPTLEMQYGTVTTPNYSVVGFVPVVTTNTTGRIGILSGSGGLAINGFGGQGVEDRGIAISGYSGISGAITNPVISITAWKWNGVSNRTTLATTDPAFILANGANPIIYAYGNGNIIMGGVSNNDSSAVLQINGGSTGRVALKLTAQALKTTPVNGAIEFDGSTFWGTAGGARTAFSGGGGGSAAGSSKYIQYNTSGAFDANSAFEYDNSITSLGIGRAPTIGVDNYSATLTRITGVESGLASGLAYYRAINDLGNGLFAGVWGHSGGGFHDAGANDGFLQLTDGGRKLVIQTNGITANGTAAEIWFNTNNATAGKIGTNSQWTLSQYGSGTFTGTPTRNLQVTSGGAIIEGPLAASAAYVPTITNTTNVGSSAFVTGDANYTQTGNIVHVEIYCTIQPGVTATSTVITFTLPITTSVTSANGVGTGVWYDTTTPAVGLAAIASGTTGTFTFISTGTVSRGAHISFSYRL